MKKITELQEKVEPLIGLLIYERGYTALVSDWDNRTNSLFVFYKSTNYMWEPFTYSNKGDVMFHCRLHTFLKFVINVRSST